MAEKILIVEDEIALQETLAYNLKRQGYEVETVGDGKAALEIARKNKPDLILLDLMLPGMDGFEVCRTLRQDMNTPVLILTARDDEIDRVVGLEMGADDYMTKPFSMRELIARVKAMLRRVRLIREESGAGALVASPTAAPIYTFGNMIIDIGRREVKVNQQVLLLKPKEFDLLYFLVQHRGQVLSREHILGKVWDWNFIGDSRTVDVHVRWIREKIEQDPGHPQRIVTVRGVGYRFEG
jgi:DNA-binding response OmpR family regulator